MENYTRGKRVEEPLERNKIPIPNLSGDFLWMQVKSGSKMQRLTEHAIGALDNNGTRSVVWTGSGEAVIRTIACAEAVKRTRPMHQITKIAYIKCEEFWEPKVEGLDKLVVNRDIPIVHILLSLDPLDVNEAGYQSPNATDSFWNAEFRNTHPAKSKTSKKPKISAEEISAMGLQSNSKGKKNFGNSSAKKNNFQKKQPD